MSSVCCVILFFINNSCSLPNPVWWCWIVVLMFRDIYIYIYNFIYWYLWLLPSSCCFFFLSNLKLFLFFSSQAGDHQGHGAADRGHQQWRLWGLHVSWALRHTPFCFCVKFIRSAIKSHPCLVAKFSGRYVILASRPSNLKPWGTWWRELTFTVSTSRTVNMTDFLKCFQCSLSIWRFAFRFLSTSQISFIPISWEFCYVAVVYGKSFLISNIFMVKKTSFVHLEEINREITALCCPRWLADAS